MSKHRKKFRIGQIKKQQPQAGDTIAIPKKVIEAYSEAERYLTPLIIAQKMPPGTAIAFIASYADYLLTGEPDAPQHTISEGDWLGAANLLVMLWTTGAFTPSEQFPYTLEQTLEAIKKDEGIEEEKP